MPLDVRHLVPLDNENRWSDLLATLIECDPRAAAAGFDWPEGEVMVTREARDKERGRVDLVVRARDELVAVLESKVLSGLGPDQLERYHEAHPGAHRYALVHPRRLPVSVVGDWQPITWESVLGAFALSTVPWVAETATAWRHHLETVMPNVDGATVWNQFIAGEDFVLAMRARTSWVYSQLRPPAGVTLVTAQSSSGVSWVVKMTVPAAAPGYFVAVEAEERWPNRAWPKFATDPAPGALGPSVRVCLVQTGIDTSAGFNWEYLHALWPTMAAARTDWVTTSARPRAAHDRAGYQRIVDAGAPRFLGGGFGEAQTRKAHDCMFGVRIQFAPDIRLAGLVDELTDLLPLLGALAAVGPPAP